MARKKSAAQKAREEDEKRRIEADNAKKFGVHTDSQKNDSQTLPIRPPVQSSSPAPAKSRHQQHSAREHTLPLHVLHDPERRQLDLPTHKQSWDDRTDNDHNEQVLALGSATTSVTANNSHETSLSRSDLVTTKSSGEEEAVAAQADPFLQSSSLGRESSSPGDGIQEGRTPSKASEDGKAHDGKDHKQDKQQNEEQEPREEQDKVEQGPIRIPPGPPASALPTVNRPSDAARILSNYFPIKRTDDNDVFHLYNVKFEGGEKRPPPPGRICRRAVYCLIEQHFNEAQTGINIATDYSQWFITRYPLAHLDTPLEVQYYDEDSCIDKSRRTYYAQITHRKSMNKDELGKAFNGDQEIRRLGELALNLLFSRRPAKCAIRNPDAEPTMACLGAHKSFDLVGKADNLGGGLQAHQGMRRSVLASHAPLLLNVNTTTGAFYCKGPLSDVIEATDHFSSARWDHLGAFLKGCRVRTTHLKKKHQNKAGFLEKIYSVKGLAKPKAPNERLAPAAKLIKFKWSKHPDGEQDISVYDYYRTEYSFLKPKPDWLVVNCGTEARPTYFPVPVLEVLAGQPFRNVLTSGQVEKLVPLASEEPLDKQQSVISCARNILSTTDGTQGPQAALGIDLELQMVSVQAKSFAPPTVYYGKSDADWHGSVRNGGWKLNNKKFTKTTGRADKDKWSYALLQVILEDSHFLDDTNWKQAQADLNGAFLKMGLTQWQRYESSHGNDHSAILQRRTQNAAPSDEKANSQVLKTKLDQLRKHVQLVFVLLPSRSLQVYSLMKRAGDNMAGLHTICSVLKKSSRSYFLNSNWSYLWNLMLKVNLKFDGTNQWLGPNWGRSGILSRSTMFVGIDVTHPGAGSQEKAPSIAAVVTTTDSTHYAQWRASLRNQQANEGKDAIEDVRELKEMLVERLEAWKASNGGLPKHIIIYRDGGSEGFFKCIMVKEWPQITSALTSEKTYGLDPDDQPRVALICAMKRNSTRFFATHNTPKNCLGTNNNLRGGLFVDNTVTLNLKDYPDFFLQSHDSLIGTARPCHYVVLKNELGVSTEQLALLTHDMCHLFGRATRTVSCHPAVYYADLACDRARVHMRRAFVPYRPETKYDEREWKDSKMAHENLRDSMYFV